MGTKPGVFVDGSQSTLILASYLNDLRTLCYELAGDGTNAPATKAAVRSNLGATAIGDALITAATAAAARGTLGSTVTGDALFVAASQAAARSVLGLVPGVDVQAYGVDIPTVATSDAEMLTGTGTSLRSMTPANVRASLQPTFNEYSTALGTSVSLGTIPAAARRVVISYQALSTNGTSNIILTAAGTPSPAYDTSCCSYTAAAVATAQTASAILLCNSVTAATTIQGILELYHVPLGAGNAFWFVLGTGMRTSTAQVFTQAGIISYTSNADKNLVITTAGGTNAFDSGSVGVETYTWPKVGGY